MRFLKYIFCALLFVTASVADTININWINDGATYAQTTCEIGGDIILPEPPTKRGYTFKGWVAGYTRLEYIESTGTQYIDTGINFDTTTIGFKIISDNTLVQSHIGSGTANYIAGGSVSTSNGYAGAFIRITSGANNTIWYANSAADVTNEKQVSSVVSNRDIIEYNYKNSRKKLFNGVDTNYDVGSHNYGGSLLLFSVQNNTTFSSVIKMYVCAVTDGSAVVRNFIPAKRNSDSVIGMYDTVSGQFFTNAGTGEFIAGPVAENQNFYE